MRQIKIDTGDLWSLLHGGSDEPVLYVERNEDTGAPLKLSVWAASLVHSGDVVLTKEMLLHDLGDADKPDDDALEHLLPGYQEALDEILEEEL